MLCGAQTPREELRVVRLAGLQELLRVRCVPTGFHMRAVLALPSENVGAGLCSLCVHWRRRTQQLRAGHRNLTPFDHVLRLAIAPGTAPALDKRNWHKLLTRLLAPDNMFADLMPSPARSILTAMLQADPGADHGRTLALAWYEQNGRPQFFSSSKIAQAVRRHVRSAAAVGAEEETLCVSPKTTPYISTPLLSLDAAPV